MADGVIILMPVKAFTQVFFVEIVVVAQPADQRFLQVVLLFDAEIELVRLQVDSTTPPCTIG
jgi:hypothetical protein